MKTPQDIPLKKGRVLSPSKGKTPPAIPLKKGGTPQTIPLKKGGKRGLYIITSLLLFISITPAQKQRDYALGIHYSAPVDTASTAKGETITGNTIIFKGPKVGSVVLWGYARKLSGSDTSFTVWIRQVTDNTVTPREYGPWDSLGVIAESDSIPYMFVLSRQTWWGENDGFQPKFIIADTTGGRAYEVAAKSVSR